MKPKGIVIHCSDSPQGRGDTAEDIHRWHVERGFDGVGYHYVILEDGTVQNGRPDYWQGAHASGYNDYLGVCLIGKDVFTDDQMLSLKILVCDKMLEHGFNKSKIIGHNQVSSKTCPNFDVTEWKRFYSAITPPDSLSSASATS